MTTEDELASSLDAYELRDGKWERVRDDEAFDPIQEELDRHPEPDEFTPCEPKWQESYRRAARGGRPSDDQQVTVPTRLLTEVLEVVADLREEDPSWQPDLAHGRALAALEAYLPWEPPPEQVEVLAEALGRMLSCQHQSAARYSITLLRYLDRKGWRFYPKGPPWEEDQ